MHEHQQVGKQCPGERLVFRTAWERLLAHVLRPLLVVLPSLSIEISLCERKHHPHAARTQCTAMRAGSNLERQGPLQGVDDLCDHCCVIGSFIFQKLAACTKHRHKTEVEMFGHRRSTIQDAGTCTEDAGTCTD